jgi:CheY-like chemotaxis protein
MSTLHGLRVLVLEDEAAIALMIEDMVEALGCSLAGSAATVAEALRLVHRGGFDFALLDMNLGGTPAEPVADALAAAGIPFLFATGYGQQGLPARFKTRPVIQKPFLTAQLERMIREMVRAG